MRSKELDAARAFLDEHRGPYILEELLSYNPVVQFSGELDTVERIRSREERTRAWTDLAPRLPASIWSHFWRKALSAARRNRDGGQRIRALAELSVHLPDPQGSQVWSEAMQAASKIKNESERMEILAALRRWEPGLLLAKELIAARQTENGFAKASAFAKIAPRLPESQRIEVMTEALAAACAIEDRGQRAGAMIELSPGLKGLRFSALHDLWRQILPSLARRSRPDLLIDLWGSQAFLYELGGSDVAAGVFRGVHTVGEWWP